MIAQSQTDFDLLDTWRAGDQAAARALFDRYFDPLYRFFRNKTNDSIDDLIQDTFLACLESRDRFRGQSSFRTYIFAIARNMLYRECYRKCRTNEKVDFTVTSLEDLGTTITRAIANKNEQKLVLHALRRIPLDYQVVLELYYWEDMSGTELAETLGIPEPAVRSRLRRGLEHLRKQIGLLASSKEELASTTCDLEGWSRSLGRLGSDPSNDQHSASTFV